MLYCPVEAGKIVKQAFKWFKRQNYNTGKCSDHYYYNIRPRILENKHQSIEDPCHSDECKLQNDKILEKEKEIIIL